MRHDGAAPIIVHWDATRGLVEHERASSCHLRQLLLLDGRDRLQACECFEVEKRSKSLPRLQRSTNTRGTLRRNALR
jgi:hypothetical protein